MAGLGTHYRQPRSSTRPLSAAASRETFIPDTDLEADPSLDAWLVSNAMTCKRDAHRNGWWVRLPAGAMEARDAQF